MTPPIRPLLIKLAILATFIVAGLSLWAFFLDMLYLIPFFFIPFLWLFFLPAWRIIPWAWIPFFILLTCFSLFSTSDLAATLFTVNLAAAASWGFSHQPFFERSLFQVQLTEDTLLSLAEKDMVMLVDIIGDDKDFTLVGLPHPYSVVDLHVLATHNQSLDIASRYLHLYPKTRDSLTPFRPYITTKNLTPKLDGQTPLASYQGSAHDRLRLTHLRHKYA